MNSRGRDWETGAARFLRRSAGLRLVANNYRCRFGEIDLIMNDRGVISFVEVRYRSPSAFGSGADSVGPRKQQRLIRAARHFLVSHPELADRPCRFDVVSVSGRWFPKYEWIKDAFQL